MRTQRKAREAGMVAAVLVIVAVLYTLFSTPSLSVLRDGSYPATMEALGLTDLEAAQEGEVVEQYAYQRYDMGELFSLSAPAIAYPAALVRLVTQPFGRNFDTRLLACVYALMMGLGAYMTVRGLWPHSRLAAAGAGGLFVILGTYTPAVCYLNSLCENGAILAFFVLYLGAVVRCLCRPRGCGIGPAMFALICAALLLRAQAQMIVLAPFMAAVLALCVRHVLPRDERRGLSLLCCGLMLLWCVQGVGAGFAADPDVQSDAANYLAVFQGYLPASDDVEGDLRSLGLPEDCAADVGRSYYDAEEAFAHNPRSEEERDGLLNRIGLGQRIRFCISHPQRIARMLSEQSNGFYDAYNDRMVTSDGQTRYMRPSPLILIDMILPVEGADTLEIYMLAGALMCLLCALAAPKGTGLTKLCVCLCLTLLGMACYLPACLALTGVADMDMIKVVVFVFGWVGLLAAIAAGLCFANRVMIWLAGRDAPLRRREEIAEVLNRRRRAVPREALLICCAVICAVIGVCTLAPDVHIGGVNNGDYGRMMDQLGLFWTDEVAQDLSAQSSRVIEEYTTPEPFHLERLTAVEPSYSLSFPAALARMWSQLTGSPFSTRTIAAVLFFVTSLCILLMIHDLYPLLGGLTILPAAGLIAMLLGENYVAWYNALFGESMVSVGLAATLACALHLITMPRSSRKSWLWLLLLGFSIRLLTCAKAQMALALPGGLALLIGLCIYHHPKGAKKLTAYGLAALLTVGLICWNTLGVYQKNEGVSARQTVWQSVFYGALMIAEDPDAAMEELGIDPAMKADIGKDAYCDDEDYVYPLYSQEALEGFYDHVNTTTMVLYYLRHPLDLLKMLDHAAKESVYLHEGFMAYTDEVFAEHRALTGFTVWMHLRPATACRAFWQYVVVYGAAVILCMRILCRRKSPAMERMFALLFLCVMAIGVLQYPLSVVGNGFADNNKQLYGFMLCHDWMVLFAVTAAANRLRHGRRGTAMDGGCRR
jgi:hypothetical protein